MCPAVLSASAWRRRLAGVWAGWPEELVDEVGAVHFLQRAGDVGAISTVIPEEIFPLSEFCLGCGGREDFLECVGVITGVIYLGRECHGGRCEVLHLFEMEVKLLCLGSEFGHIHLVTSGMGGYEVGDELLFEPMP